MVAGKSKYRNSKEVIMKKICFMWNNIECMNSFKYIFSVIGLTLTLFGILQAQIRNFSEAEGVRAANDKIYGYESWNFPINTDKYEINKGGCGKKTSKNNVIKKFCFSIKDAAFIDKAIYFAEYQGDLVILGELSFGDSGSGFIVRINEKTLTTKWRTSIPTFNIAKGLIEDNSAYLAATGFVSKVDLESGKYIWKYDDLYRKYDESGAFNVFLTPQVENNLVIFKEEDTLKRGFNHQIHVNKSSGKIIKVILN